MKVPKGRHALPGAFPGRVVEVKDPRSLVDDKLDAKVVAEMFERGVRTLTGKDMKESFGLFFEPGDVVVQRGTTHTWINRGSVPAVTAFILIDAQALE